MVVVTNISAALGKRVSGRANIIAEGRIVIVALCVYGTVKLSSAGAAAFQILTGTTTGIGDWLALFDLIVLLVTGILVLRWIYHANKGAQALAEGMSMSPGWNVGYFFIPFANLWKPFEGVRETWQVSAAPNDWPNQPIPTLLRLWWGLWIAVSLIGNISARIHDPSTAHYFTLIDGALAVMLALVLMRVVRDLSAMQADAIAAQVFL